MKFTSVGRVLLAAAALLISVCVRADLTTTAKIQCDLSQVSFNGQPLTAQMRQMLDRTGMFGPDATITTYYSATKVKSIAPMAISIMDTDSNLMTVLMPQTKTYLSMPLNKGAVKQVANATEANAVDMKTTKTILGHEAHLYKLYLKNPMMTMTGYAWVAPDLPSPPAFASDNTMLSAFREKLAGALLKESADMSMSMFTGKISMTYEVTSLNTDAIDPATFDIPSGYTQMQTPAAMPPAPAANH